MRKKKINGFTCFLMILISLTLFFFLRLTYEIQKEKQQYTILISLGNLSYDQNFLKKASKINGLQEIWPVVEIPVTIKIEDYTKTTVFCGIDLNAFTEISGQDNLGNTPRLLLGSNSLENMKDSNGHAISKKQQNKYLKMGEQLAITYTLDSIDSNKILLNTAVPFPAVVSRLWTIPGIIFHQCPVFPVKLLQYSPEKMIRSISRSPGKNSVQRIWHCADCNKGVAKDKGKDNLENAKQHFE